MLESALICSLAKISRGPLRSAGEEKTVPFLGTQIQVRIRGFENNFPQTADIKGMTAKQKRN